MVIQKKSARSYESSEENPLTKTVHVDEFEIGTSQKGKPGRSKSESKIRIVLAVEVRGNKSGRAYAEVIEDFSCKSLTPIFETHINPSAYIVTDKWSGYQPLKSKFPKLTSQLSNNGNNYKVLHFKIRNFNNWLRGVHSYCSKRHMTQYINEHFYRFNRLNFRETVLEKLLIRMCEAQPITYKSIKYNVT